MPASFVNGLLQGVSREGINKDLRRVKKMKEQQQLLLSKDSGWADGLLHILLSDSSTPFFTQTSFDELRLSYRVPVQSRYHRSCYEPQQLAEG